MNITIYGTGYVGLVTGTCLAELGHQILCIDINAEKIASLQKGDIPIFEPGLSELITKNMLQKRLSFSTDSKLGVKHGLVQMICVNTPSDHTGAADLTNVFNCAKNIAENLKEYRLIINKSTSPMGTAHKIQNIMSEMSHKKNISFDVASNPEFLKEGSAVKDFLHPDRVIIGVESTKAQEILLELYHHFHQQNKLILMNVISAEFTKYVANAMLATKISFINEMANLAEKVGADIDMVRKGIGSDPRIGHHFIAPGCGYGGSCFPKDVSALIHIAKENNIDAHLLKAVHEVNYHQKQVLFHKLQNYFGAALKNKTIAILGLAFKPNTNDIREASSRVLLESLWQAGVKVKAYDPIAMPEILAFYGKREDLILCESSLETCVDADALVIVTEWPEFKEVQLSEIKKRLKNPVIFDGRNLLSKDLVLKNGFEYFGVGR